jgi:hypothetical protein
MNIFIKGLFTELYNRSNKMLNQLNDLSMPTVASGNFKKLAEDHLFELTDRIKTIIKSGILEDDFFTTNVMILYKSINIDFLESESYLFLPIKKYDQAIEGYFEKIVTSIYEEIGLAQSVPFISVISNASAYFWAYLKYQMIALPQGEENYLLNLNDLYHEIAHFIFNQYGEYLVGGFMKEMKDEYEKKIKGSKTRKGIELKKVLEKAMDYWENSWAEELACDLMATYLVGPAHVWGHMKVCMVSSGSNALYGYGEMFREHPPDEVRMRAVLKMLMHIGCTEDAEKISIAWENFKAVTDNEKKSIYEELFASALIDSMAQHVYDGCKNIGLRSYPQQKAYTTQPVSQVINDAWDKMRENTGGYDGWEEVEVQRLRSRMSYL